MMGRGKTKLYLNMVAILILLIYFALSGVQVIPAKAAGPSVGTGLTGKYFAKKDFTECKAVKTKEGLNVNWGTGSPATNIGADRFSVIWEGLIEPLYSEEYTFYSTTDANDGVRIWIEGHNVLDNFATTSNGMKTGTKKQFVGGKKYKIRIEYFENTGNAKMCIEWSSKSQPKQVIPKERLYPPIDLDTTPPLPSISEVDITEGAKIVKIDKAFDFTETVVGKEETIHYKIYGDDFVVDYPKDIALVIDVSGSMRWTLSGAETTVESQKRINILKNAVKNFAAQFVGRNTRICLVPFSYYAEAYYPMVYMKDANSLDVLNEQIDHLLLDDGTNIGDGMRVAYQRLMSCGKKIGKTDISKYIVLLTDGEPNKWTEDPLSAGGFYTGSSLNMIDYTLPHWITVSGSNYKTPYGAYDSGSNPKSITYCTSVMGSILSHTQNLRSFIIGFTSSSNDATLESIGLQSGAAKVAANGNKHYYRALTSSDLINTYKDISKIILDDIPISDTLFTEILPKGTEFTDIRELKEFVQNSDVEVRVKDDGRQFISVPLILLLEKAYKSSADHPQFDQYPYNQTYRLKPIEFSIKVKFVTPPGGRTFSEYDTSINYLDPFTGAYENYFGGINQTINVFEVDIQSPVIFVGGGWSTVTGRLSPTSAINRSPTWMVSDSTMTVLRLHDENKDDFVVQVEAPEERAPGIRNPGGHIPIRLSLNINGSTYIHAGELKVVDAWLQDMLIQRGRTQSVETAKSGETDDIANIRFEGWAANKPGITVSRSGDITAHTPGDYIVTATAVYEDDTVRIEKPVHCKVTVVDVTIDNVALFLGESTVIRPSLSMASAELKPPMHWQVVGENSGTRIAIGSPGSGSTAISAVHAAGAVTADSACYRTLEFSSRVANGGAETAAVAQNTVTVVAVKEIANQRVQVFNRIEIGLEAYQPEGAGGSFFIKEITSSDPSKIEVTSLGGVKAAIRGKGLTTGAGETVTVTLAYTDAGKGLYAEKVLTFKVKSEKIVDIQ